MEPLKVLNQFGNAIKMKLMNLVKQFHYLLIDVAKLVNSFSILIYF